MRNGRRPPGSGSRDTAYRQWIAQVESPAWAGFTSTPGAPALISVLTRDVETVRSTPEQQTYTNWEVTANVASASGEYVLFLNGSGRMPNYALAAMAQGAAAFHADLLYADEDHLDDAGHRTAPVFKPAWSPELLRSTPYLGAPLLVRRELLVSLGAVDGLDSDHGLYGLAVAISSRTDRIVHVPVVLFHRNETNDSSMAHKSVAPEHTDGEQNRLAVIVCSRNPNLLRRCLRAVVGSARAPLQLIAVEHRLGGPDPEMTRVVGEFGAVSVPWYGAFNFAAMNNAGASLATAPYLLFLNDDVTVAGAGWAAKVIRELANPNIGVAGSVLRYPGGSVQHAGIVLGIGDGVGHVARFETDTPLWPWLRLTRDVSAVTGAFFAVGSQLFRELGGFDPAFPNNYNDVDFCLRARARGISRSVRREFRNCTRGVQDPSGIGLTSPSASGSMLGGGTISAKPIRTTARIWPHPSE